MKTKISGSGGVCSRASYKGGNDVLKMVAMGKWVEGNVEPWSEASRTEL